MNIEHEIQEAATKAVLSYLKQGSWLQPDFTNRLKIPQAWIEHAWTLVDSAHVQRQIALLIEQELAQRIVNHMAAEIATDIKQILSVRERREAIRSLVRENIDKICGAQS